MKNPERRKNKEVELIPVSTFIIKPYKDEHPQHDELDHPPQNQHEQPFDHLHYQLGHDKHHH